MKTSISFETYTYFRNKLPTVQDRKEQDKDQRQTTQFFDILSNAQITVLVEKNTDCHFIPSVEIVKGNTVVSNAI